MEVLTGILIGVIICYIMSRLDQLADQGAVARKQSASAALTQLGLASLRDRIFNLKQSAEMVLSQDGAPDKVTTAAISILEARLHNPDVTPALFPDLSDKEYVLNTVRLVSASKNRLLEQLSPDEQAEVARVTAMGVRLPDYDYYLGNFRSGRQMMEAVDAVAKTRVGFILALNPVVIPMLLFFLVLGGLWIGDRVAEGDGSVIGYLVGIGVWVAILITWLNGKEYRYARQVMAKFEDKLDLARFAALDKEFGGEGIARQLQERARRDLAAFFGDSELLSCVEQLCTSK